MKRERGKKTRPETIDEYLSALDAGRRSALEKLRKDIHAAAPGAEECISYGLPAFRLGGKMLAWFGAAANHCSFYPGAVVQSHEKLLRGYDTSKGTVRFPPDRPLPASVVRTLVKARARDNAARAKAKASRRGPA